LSDFRSDSAKQNFLRAEELKKQITGLESELEELRNEYALSSNAKRRNLSSSILSKEDTWVNLTTRLKETEKTVRNLEIKQLNR
jgi:predicted RNase H-like nuclease (RuvC/YqgF family)